MKTNQQVDPAIDVEAGTVVITIADGGQPIVFDSAKASAVVMRRAALVGMAQVRLIDAAAVGVADKDGNVRTKEARLAMKRERIQALVDHYHTGTEDWSRVKSASGATGGYLFEALCAMYAASQTPEQIRAFLDGLTTAEQNALRDDDEVAPHIARIKAEKNSGKPTVDTKGLLGKIAAPAPIDE